MLSVVIHFYSHSTFLTFLSYNHISLCTQVAKASIIVGDPSYFEAGKTRVVGKVVRSICILNHPIAGTDNAESVQIIIPAKQVSNLFFELIWSACWFFVC